jgi:Zn-dependent M16 (insulinase) family peptidase
MSGTPYDFESGGDPEEILQLSYEGLKEFHRSRYSPANCRIFLAGNISTERQLEFLNDEFFCKIPGGNACEPIAKTQRWKEPKKFNVPCPAGNEKKSTIFLSWLCSDVVDVNENIALAALTEILLGHDGSPLTRALVESGIGEDITPVSGLEGEIREILFVAGLKSIEGNAEQKSKEVEELITGVFRRLVSEGIPADEIEAALLSLEFSQREIRRSSGPFSLVWMRRSMRAWLHGCKPWESLLISPAIEKLKENILNDERYFEKLIQKYLIDNPHRALVILEPKDNFLQEQEKKLSLKLADIEKNLNEIGREQIINKSLELEKIQSEVDTPEALASIPHLARSDLSSKIDSIHRRHEDLRGVPALCHDLYTNGITYIDLSFPVDIFLEDDYPWLQFFSRVILSVGLPGMDYGEVSSLMARTVGGFLAILHTGSAIKGTDLYLKTASGNFDLAGRDWILFRIKCLDEKIAASLDLALRLITEADFSDSRRINDLVLEMKNEIDSSLAPMGHMYSSSRAGRFNSRSKIIEEKWAGITQIEFVHELAKMNTSEIIKKLYNIQEKLKSAGLIANLTGGSDGLKIAASQISQKFSGFGPPVPRSPCEFTSGKPASCCDAGARVSSNAEVFASNSLQVGFAAMALNAAPFNTIQQIAELVLTHQMNTGALWEDIRMKGGAYGAFVNSDCLENCMSFATYRDPNPLRSLDIFSQLITSESINYMQEKSIIGCYSKETRPRTAAEDGLIDFYRFLYGIEDSYRKNKLERLISVSEEDIAAAFKAFASKQRSGSVIITGVKKAEEAAKALGVEVQHLKI